MDNLPSVTWCEGRGVKLILLYFTLLCRNVCRSKYDYMTSTSTDAIEIHSP